jgi:hypothetical protein
MNRDESPFSFLKECVIALIESLFIKLIHIVMKKLLYIQGQDALDQLKNVQQLPAEKQRFLYYTGKPLNHLHTYQNKFQVTKGYVNNDDEIVFINATYLIMINKHSGKMFATNNLNGGMKVTRNGVEFWKGMKIDQVSGDVIKTVLKELNIDWLTDDYYRLLTNSSFNRVVKGRVTNPKQLMKHYLTYSGRVRHLKLNRYSGMLLNIYNESKYLFDKLMDGIIVEENIERTIQYINNAKRLPEGWRAFYHSDALIRECKALDVKISMMWSKARLEEKHTKLSRIIREREVEYMEMIDYSYELTCPVLPGMELIDNNKRLMQEGAKMDHCIYSYLDKAIDRKLFHFHCTFGDRHASLAIMRSHYHDSYVVQQFHGVRNSGVSDDQLRIVSAWLEEPAVQEWFKLEHEIYLNRKEESLMEPQDILPF